MSRKVRAVQADQKMAILKQHLLEKKAVSDLCEEHKISPSAFYRWQQELFDNGAQCFQGQQSGVKQRTAEAHRISQLESKLSKQDVKLSQKNEVIAELMEEHVTLKKSLLDD